MEVYWYTGFRRSHNALLSSFMWHKLLKLIFECRTNYTFFVFVAFILHTFEKSLRFQALQLWDASRRQYYYRQKLSDGIKHEYENDEL